MNNDQLTAKVDQLTAKVLDLAQRMDDLVNRLGSGYYTEVNQGNPTETDGDAHQGTAPASYDGPGYEQSQTNRINNLIDAHNSLTSGSVTSLVTRVNKIQDMLRSAGMMG